MTTSKPMLSAAALSTFHTYLPGDLTEDQASKVMEAAGEMAQQVWHEATSAHATLTAIRNEYRRKPPPKPANA